MRFKFSRNAVVLLLSVTSLVLLFGCGGGGGGSAAPTYSITGRVVDNNGAGVPNVVVNLNSGSAKPAKAVESTVASTHTDGTGTYTFNNVQAGTYTVSSNDAVYGFSPVSLSVSATSLTFPAAVAFKVYSITGTITLANTTTPLPNLTVNLTGDSTASQSTGSDGVYTFTGLRSGTYTVTPAVGGTYVFVPNSAPVTITDHTVTGQDFAGSIPTFTVSGSITATAGAAVNLALTKSGTAPISATTTSDGSYSFPQVPNGSYTLTSTDVNYGITATPVTVSGAAVTVPAIAAYPVFAVTGTITLLPGGSGFGSVTVKLYKMTVVINPVIGGLYGATVTFADTGRATPIDPATGSFTFSGVTGGSYAILPASSAYLFNPDNSDPVKGIIVFSILANDASKAYIYDSTKTGNTVTPLPLTSGSIIYQNTVAMSALSTGNTLSGMNFTGSIPGGTSANPK